MTQGPIYQQLASHYGEAIERNTLRLGMRMPSVRELMRRHRVSLSTALQALRLLEERGWVEARPRVGYFVRQGTMPTLEDVPEADLRAPLEAAGTTNHPFAGINERISVLVESARRADVRVDLGGATPGPELFDTAWMNRTAVALLREQPELLVLGRSTAGSHPAFQAAMALRALDGGIRVAPHDVLATVGNTEAVHLALSAVTQLGDVVAVESPTYYGLLQGIESLGLQTLEIPCSQSTGISLEALDLAMRTQPRLRAVVVVPDLQMPLGTLMPDDRKAALAAFCRAHDVALVGGAATGRRAVVGLVSRCAARGHPYRAGRHVLQHRPLRELRARELRAGLHRSRRGRVPGAREAGGDAAGGWPPMKKPRGAGLPGSPLVAGQARAGVALT